jgi:hypothetical protein
MTASPTQQTNSAALAAGSPALVGQAALASRGPAPVVRPAGSLPVFSRANPPGWPSDAVLGGPEPQMNTPYRGTMPFLGHTIPLPDGDWTVISRNAVETRDRTPVSVRIVLERNDGPVLTGLMVLGGNPASHPFPHGLPVSPICTGSDVILADAGQADPGGDLNCATVDFHRSTFLRDATSPMFVRVAGNGLDQRNISPPPTLVGTAFIVATRTHSLVGDVFFNPDRAGIAPDVATQRAMSGWTAFNIAKDPAKQAFAQKVLDWSRGWRAALKLALAGKSPRLPPDVATTP